MEQNKSYPLLYHCCFIILGKSFFNIHKVFVEIYYRNFRKDKFPRQWYSASSHDIKWAQWPNFNKKVFFSPCIFCTDLMIIILHQLYTTAGYWKNTNKDFLFNNKILQYNVQIYENLFKNYIFCLILTPHFVANATAIMILNLSLVSKQVY